LKENLFGKQAEAVGPECPFSMSIGVACEEEPHEEEDIWNGAVEHVAVVGIGDDGRMERELGEERAAVDAHSYHG